MEAPHDAEVGELALEVVEVARHERHHVDIGHRGGGALVLANLRHHLGRAGNGKPGRHLGDEAGQRLLVDGIAVGVEQGDGDRLHALREQRGDGRPRAGLVERARDLAVGAHALRHLPPQVAGRQRRRRVDEEVVHVIAAFTADLERVPEAGGGEQPGARAFSLDEGVGGQGGAVDEAADASRRRARLLQEAEDALLHRLGRILRRGE